MNNRNKEDFLKEKADQLNALLKTKFVVMKKRFDDFFEEVKAEMSAELLQKVLPRLVEAQQAEETTTQTTTSQVSVAGSSRGEGASTIASDSSSTLIPQTPKHKEAKKKAKKSKKSKKSKKEKKDKKTSSAKKDDSPGRKRSSAVLEEAKATHKKAKNE